MLLHFECQLKAQAARAKNLSAIKCVVKVVEFPTGFPRWRLTNQCHVVGTQFQFFGGSFGCVEGEKLTRGFEYACANGLPVMVLCASDGARMHEGTLSPMQMAKLSCAVQSHADAHLPFLTLLGDPCDGGVKCFSRSAIRCVYWCLHRRKTNRRSQTNSCGPH